MKTLLKISILFLLLLSFQQKAVAQSCVYEHKWSQDFGGGFYANFTFCVQHPFEKSRVTGNVYYKGIQLGRTDTYWRSSKGYLRIEWTGAYMGLKIYFNPEKKLVSYKTGRQNMITYKWTWGDRSKHLLSF